jgi:hypothetical protein
MKICRRVGIGCWATRLAHGLSIESKSEEREAEDAHSHVELHSTMPDST